MGHAIATLWRLLWTLLRDLAAPLLGERERDEDGLAQDDDLLDAWLDDDEMDASGL